jgi:N-acyl-D-amino-acid deacylase
MLLIRNVQIVDGRGGEPYKADVLIKGSRISAIGNFAGKKADKMINGAGAYLAPGFIDVNTDSDHYLTLFTNPAQQDFLLQGVTTIIGGNCGSSLAPLIRGDLRSIRKWADVNVINVGWHSMSEFLNVVEKLRLGVNFGTLVGHSTVRRDIIGEELRDLTDQELISLRFILQRALEEGAFGISTGLGYAHSRQTPHYELRALAEIAAKYNGVYATHLRNEEEKLVDSVRETIDLAVETGVKTIISHLRPIKGFEKQFAEAILLIEKQSKGREVFFDSYLSDISVLTIYRLLPEWVQNGGFEVMARNILQPAVRERLIKELNVLNGDDILIAQAPGHEFLVNKTLSVFAANYEMSIGEALLELIELTEFRAVVLYRNINLESLTKALSSSHALVASNSASFPVSDKAASRFTHIKFVRPERSSDTFTKFIGAAEKGELLKLSEAVHKITALPAAIFGLRDRGIIAEGNAADITIFKDGKIKHVIVNGEVVVEDAKFQNILAGSILKHET